MSLKKNSTDDIAAVDSTKVEEEGSFAQIDPVAEKRLVRKLDLILLPMFCLIYCANFVDRTAIGNAKIAGLEKDLGMHGNDLNIALTIFYICFMIVEVPSNLALKRIGSTWVAYLVIGFGVVALGSAFMRNYAELLVTRVFLGLAEGGTLAGLVYTIARYYRRHELVLRMGFFFGLAPSLAGSFGGLLSSGLLALDDFGSVKRWRKIFFVEGIITIGIGILLVFFIPDDPRKTKMLNEEERKLAIARINADATVETDGLKEKATLKLVLRSFNIWTLTCAMGYLFVNISFQGLSLFLPTVVNSLGKFTVVEAQLRTVPCYIVGAVWAISSCFMSWYLNSRGIAIIVCMLFQALGYAITIGTKNPHARYAACFFSIMGGTPSGPLFLTWGADNAAPDTMRAVATAAIPGIGSLGAIIGVWTYLPTDAPDFHKGNSLNLASALFVITFTILGMFYLKHENMKRERGERDYRLEGRTEEQIRDLGYRHPRFRYQL
ncbi:MFS general substrate transporter [Macrolepiota fuliginosa MF-IS2]|uniref:MFS general substrate transporter n=1 Tax=Macrolepiota fuliginosa MF-IS2 TaxID=1400762 RepID=A0A9P5XA40_9AGAR|nr:MFS general substrate transporter [Macrolepiota fuliginosa MF-IS2]